jgi:hypothetical protein
MPVLTLDACWPAPLLDCACEGDELVGAASESRWSGLHARRIEALTVAAILCTLLDSISREKTATRMVAQDTQ